MYQRSQQHCQVQNMLEAIKRPYIDITATRDNETLQGSFKDRSTWQAHDIKNKYAD